MRLRVHREEKFDLKGGVECEYEIKTLCKNLNDNII